MADAPAGFTEVSDSPAGFREVTAAPPPDDRSPFVGAVMDTFGLTDRPGKRTMLDVLARPEGALEHAASLAVTAPTISLGGAGAGALVARAGIPLLTKLAPVAGRIATSGALGAGGSAARGDSAVAGGLTDAGITAGTEGLLSAITQGRIPRIPITLKDLGSPARGFEHAKTAVLEALDLVRDRLPGIRFLVPAFGPGKLTPDEAARVLSNSTGSTYVLGLSQLADALRGAEKVKLGMSGAAKPPGMNAGQIFRRFTEPERFDPGVVAKGAEGLRRGLDSTAARSGLDALMSEEAEGLPLGALGAAAMIPAVTSRIPGLK